MLLLQSLNKGGESAASNLAERENQRPNPRRGNGRQRI